MMLLSSAVATFSQLELASEMARVATMEVVDFWHFVEILIVQVFQKFNKQFSQKVCVCTCLWCVVPTCVSCCVSV